MEILEMTCKQYVDFKWEEFKKTRYYINLCKLKKENKDRAEKLVNDYNNKYKTEWKNKILEYGLSNKLPNKIIYSYIREFSYINLIYDFRNGNALEGWIPTEKYTLNTFK